MHQLLWPVAWWPEDTSRRPHSAPHLYADLEGASREYPYPGEIHHYPVVDGLRRGSGAMQQWWGWNWSFEVPPAHSLDTAGSPGRYTGVQGGHVLTNTQSPE